MLVVFSARSVTTANCLRGFSVSLPGMEISLLGLTREAPRPYTHHNIPRYSAKRKSSPSGGSKVVRQSTIQLNCGVYLFKAAVYPRPLVPRSEIRFLWMLAPMRRYPTNAPHPPSLACLPCFRLHHPSQKGKARTRSIIKSIYIPCPSILETKSATSLHGATPAWPLLFE